MLLAYYDVWYDSYKHIISNVLLWLVSDCIIFNFIYNRMLSRPYFVSGIYWVCLCCFNLQFYAISSGSRVLTWLLIFLMQLYHQYQDLKLPIAIWLKVLIQMTASYLPPLLFIWNLFFNLKFATEYRYQCTGLTLIFNLKFATDQDTSALDWPKIY